MPQLAALRPDLGKTPDPGRLADHPSTPTSPPWTRAPHRFRRTVTALLVALIGGAVGLTVLPATAEAAVPIPTSAHRYPVLAYNSRGSAVKYVQQRLRVSPTSGWFGPITTRHVRAFQKRHHLAITGRVTWREWRQLGVRYIAPPTAPTSGRPGSKQWGDRVLAITRQKQGDPYVYGAAGPSAFDCSGLTMYVMKRMGVTLTHSASEQRRSPKVRAIRAEYRRPGDLVFVRWGSGASHVAIYAGGGKWWEAPKPGTSVLIRPIWTTNVAYGRIRG
jgi:cell wall-associated NlpC family hydrolase